jgi:hypothetical protein
MFLAEEENMCDTGSGSGDFCAAVVFVEISCISIECGMWKLPLLCAISIENGRYIRHVCNFNRKRSIYKTCVQVHLKVEECFGVAGRVEPRVVAVAVPASGAVLRYIH